MGPDGDFTISFPDVPSRETNVTPQRTFTGQTTTLFSSKTGEARLFSINYKDLPARAASAGTQLILTEYERGCSWTHGVWSTRRNSRTGDGNTSRSHPSRQGV